MDNLFTNVGAKLKAFAKTYFQITMWLLIIGGVISFFVLLAMGEEMAPFAFGVLLYVPLMILSTLVSCWVLHAFGSIAEKHEVGNVTNTEVTSVAQPQKVVETATETNPENPLSTEKTGERDEQKKENKKEDTIAAIVLMVSVVVIIVLALIGSFL